MFIFITSGHTALVEILLDRGADPLIPDKNGVRPLHYAAQNNFGKTVNAMLQHEHVKDVPDNDKRTALMWAAAKGISHNVSSQSLFNFRTL